MNFETNSPLYTKYDCLVLMVNDKLIEYYNSRQLCVSEHSKSKQPFFVVHEAINLGNPAGFYYMLDNKYLKNVHVKIYSCKLLEYLYDFNIHESTLEYEFSIDFEKINTIESYTEGEFTYESSSGFLIKKNNKKYVQLYGSFPLSCLTSSYSCISTIVLY